MQAQFETVDGQRISVRGFSAINREKLKALSGNILAKLAAWDELELAYLHLHSMSNLNLTAALLGEIPASADHMSVADTEIVDTAPPAEAADEKKPTVRKRARKKGENRGSES